MDYKNKYLKYKSKYNNLKIKLLHGGGNAPAPVGKIKIPDEVLTEIKRNKMNLNLDRINEYNQYDWTNNLVLLRTWFYELLNNDKNKAKAVQQLYNGSMDYAIYILENKKEPLSETQQEQLESIKMQKEEEAAAEAERAKKTESADATAEAKRSEIAIEATRIKAEAARIEAERQRLQAEMARRLAAEAEAAEAQRAEEIAREARKRALANMDQEDADGTSAISIARGI